MRCYCNDPAIGRRGCPQHHHRSKQNFAQKLNIRKAGTIRHGGPTTERNLIDKTLKLTWTKEELKDMTVEELWTVANILQLPQMKPEIFNFRTSKLELLRHIKALLKLYSPKAMEKYFEMYGSIMGDIIPRK